MELDRMREWAQSFTEPRPGRPIPRFILTLAVAVAYVKSGARTLADLDDAERAEVVRLCKFYEMQDRAYWLTHPSMDYKTGHGRKPLSMTAAVEHVMEARDKMAAIVS